MNKNINPEHFDKGEATEGMRNPLDLTDMLELNFLEKDETNWGNEYTIIRKDA